MKKPPIILSIDQEITEETNYLIELLSKYVSGFKINPKGLFNPFVHQSGTLDLMKADNNILLADMKLFDVPTSNIEIAKSLEKIGVTAVTAHTSNGKASLKKLTNNTKLDIIGVSVLSSFSNEDCKAVYNQGLVDQIIHLFYKVRDVKLGGIVCAPTDLEIVNEQDPHRRIKRFCVGIRRRTDQPDDHKRFMSPKQAILLGADYLIIGRPILKSKDPIAEIKKIIEEIT